MYVFMALNLSTSKYLQSMALPKNTHYAPLTKAVSANGPVCGPCILCLDEIIF